MFITVSSMFVRAGPGVEDVLLRTCLQGQWTQNMKRQSTRAETGECEDSKDSRDSRDRRDRRDRRDSRLYLLVGKVADVEGVAVLVQLLRPAAWRRVVLTVGVAAVGAAETGVLRGQRLESPDRERREGEDGRRERERSGLQQMC